MDVSIFRPFETAALSASVSPLHVTVTAPAARLCVAARVSRMKSDVYMVVGAFEVAGEAMAHALFDEMAVIRPTGNASVILLPVA